MARPFAEIGDFHELTDPLGDRPFRGRFEHSNVGLELTKAESKASDPIDVRWAMGGDTPGPIIWTTAGHPLIVSSKVVDLLHGANATGWTTYGVNVYAKGGTPCPGYSGIAVHGTVGPLDYGHSSIELIEYPTGPWPGIRGYKFDPASWSGDDFCIPEGTSLFIVTSRIAKVLKAARIPNLSLTRISDVLQGLHVIRRERWPENWKERIQAAYAKRDFQPPAEFQ